MAHRAIRDLAMIALLFLLPLLLFWPQTIGGKTLLPTENIYQFDPYATYRDVVRAPAIPHNHLVSDLVLQNYQWKTLLRANLTAGELPLWNPHQFSGIPFMAAGQQSTLYPLSILYYILPLTAAYGWFTVINLWLAGCAMYGFMRGLNHPPIGAAVPAITYQLCGFFIASVVFPMIIGAIVWLPALLLMGEFLIQRRTVMGRPGALIWVSLGAVMLGCNIYAGHVEITLYTLLILAYYTGLRLAYALFTAYRRRDSAGLRAALTSAGWIALMTALGFGIGAAQFIPLYEFVNVNFRATRSDINTVLSYAHPFRDLIQFALPNFYGSPAHHSYFDLFSLERLPVTLNALGETRTHTEWGIKNYVEAALYVGILPLLLAGYALIDTVRHRAQSLHRLIFASLGLLSLSFMFGLPTYALVYLLPGINQLNSPFRWVFGLTVSISILAGYGAAALAPHPPARWTRRFGSVISGFGLLILTGAGISRLIYPQIEPLIQRVIDSMALATTAFSGPRMFYSYQLPQIIWLGVIVTACGIVLWLAGRPSRRAIPLWQWLAVGLIAADLLAASWDFNPASDPLLLDFTPPGVQWLIDRQAEGEIFRYTVINTWGKPEMLQSNLTLRYGLDDIRGYDSIIPLQYVDYMRQTAPQGQLDFNRIAPLFAHELDQINWRRLDLLNVRYIITHNPADQADLSLIDLHNGLPRFDPVYSDEALIIWINRRALERAYLAAPQIAQITPNDPLPLIAADDAIIWQSDTGREKRLSVRLTAAPAWLVISETHLPGWRAFITPTGQTTAETPLPVERILENFQAVDLTGFPAGEYRVRLVYSPPSFQIGLFTSGLSAALIIFLVSVWLWGRLVGGNAQTDSAAARVARNSIAPILLNLFNRGIDFALAFVMLRILGPTDAGIYYYAVVIFVWFDIFTNFGLDLFMIREVARSRERSGYYFYNIGYLRIMLVAACIPLLIGFMAIRQAAVTPALNTDALIAIGLLYIGLAPGSISKGLTALFYAHERAEIPAAVTTITTINKAALQLAALLLGYGIIGLAASSILVNLLTLAILVWVGRRLIGGGIQRADSGLMRRMVGESWPLMLNHFLATIFFQVDIVILEALRGAEIVGKYSVAYRWLLALNIIPAFFTQALLPVMSRQAQHDRDALRRTYILGVKLLVMLAIPLAAAFTFLADPLVLLLGGREFMPEGAIALQIMMWSIPIGWINSLTQYALIAVDLQRRITGAFAIAVTFNIVTNLILIPQFSYRAAAVTTIFSELILLIAFGLLMQTALGRLPWAAMIWRPAAAGSVMLFILGVGWPLTPLGALFAGSAAYGMVLWTLRPLTGAEWAMLAPIAPHWMLRPNPVSEG